MTLAGERRRAKHAGRTTQAIPRPDPGALLAWYDANRRDLPWRAAPGEMPDAYRVWLSEIMLQQTRVETVARYFGRFLVRFPTVRDLAGAKLESVLKLWAGLGYYARARNLHACAREVVARHGGQFPQSEVELRALPGVGAYTAAAIAAIAFGRKSAPVDGNIERVLARIFAVETPLPAAKPDFRRLAEALVPDDRPGDFAQALMDLGATVCTPQRPACGHCPWNLACRAHHAGDPERYPRRPHKVEGRLRRGVAFVVLRADRAVLLRRRPAKGLLGGMSEVPSTAWSHDFNVSKAARAAPRLKTGANGGSRIAWRRLPGTVRHVFTHFPLELEVRLAAVPKATPAPRGMRFVPVAALAGEALPSLMRKVIAHALDVGAISSRKRGRFDYTDLRLQSNGARRAAEPA